MPSTPIRSARFAAVTKSSIICLSSAFDSSCGRRSPSSWGMAEGASISQPPWSGDKSWPPSQGVALDALRPAWANWINTGVAGANWRARLNLSLRAASVRSSHRPKQACVMRPSAVMPVASIMNKAAPLFNKLPQCIKCQSVASPLFAEYWHIGATTMRLANSNGPRGELRV